MERVVKGFENYKVTDEGMVIGPRGKFLMFDINSSGYFRVTLSKDGVATRRFVHQLVLEAFKPKPDGDFVVNHIDGNRHNNRVDNLEWVSRSYNVKDGWKRGRKPPHTYDKLTMAQLKDLFNLGLSAAKSAKVLGRDRSTVARIFKELREGATTIREE